MINSKSRIFFFILLGIYINCLNSLDAQQLGKAMFNEDWQFYKGDLNPDEATDATHEWRQVTLPHDWSIEGPFSEEWASGTGYLPGGIGRYKKEFNLPEGETGGRYAIYFDGVYKNSEIWINGNYLGKRPNGFIPFQYDLTPYLKATDNLIVVKVDHSDFADSRYYTGSGIYRNVYLIASKEHHFSQWGIFFKTPQVSEKMALAEIEIAFENHEGSNRDIQITANLKDQEGTTVATSQTDTQSIPGADNHATLSMEIDNPKRWSTDSPFLYELEVVLAVDGEQVDQWSEKVGIREFHFDPDLGFFLNGENMLIKGVCIHHDAGVLGAAVPKEVWKKRLETLKELGCNAIRMSHYPHQDYLYELSDEMGFLVQDEAFDEWEVGKNKWIEGWNVGTPGKDGYHVDFEEWAHTDLKDMILRSRNRPSVIMWSIGNEIDYPNDPYSHPVLDEGRNPQIYGRGYEEDRPPASRLGELATELVKVAKAYDSTRPVTAALAGATMSNHTDYPKVLDIVGYNYQEYRYEEDHKAFPDRVIYGSENGDALSAWFAVTENPYISSQFLWTAFDFIGEARAWPSRSSGAGIIDLAGKPKPDFYFRKSLWNDSPMVYLGVTGSKEDVNRRSRITDAWTGSVGESKWVTCYTNTDEVELFLNGKSMGRKKAVYQEDDMIAWELNYEPGELKVIGYIDKDVVAEYVLNTPDVVSQVQVTTDAGSIAPDDQIIHLDLLLTDANGNRVVNDDREVRVEIQGPATLLGLESGDLSSHESYQANFRKTYQGRLRGYIKVDNPGAAVQINITSPDLPDQTVSVSK